MADTAAPLDQDRLKQLSFTVWSYKMGQMVGAMIHLGDHLGLYRSLAGAGPVTVAALAERTGLHSRWLEEWLRGQVAAKLLTWHPADAGETDRFELTAEGAAVLADEESSLFFAAGAFGSPPDPTLIADIGESFRTGRGMPYDRLGPSGAHQTERTLGPWARLAFVPTIVPALDGLDERLRTGAVVADVGCGAGLALRTLAKAYPQSTFHGFDPSQHAIERARRQVDAEGLTNIELHQAGGEDLPATATFDFVYTFDCLHDMAHPDRVIAAIRKAIKPDGVWLIKDIRSTGDFAKNLKNPMLALFYSSSVVSCMSCALSEPDGMGLGTLGFHPHRAEEMVRAEGFSSFEIRDFEDPANLYYEVRP